MTSGKWFHFSVPDSSPVQWKQSQHLPLRPCQGLRVSDSAWAAHPTLTLTPPSLTLHTLCPFPPAGLQQCYLSNQRTAFLLHISCYLLKFYSSFHPQMKLHLPSEAFPASPLEESIAAERSCSVDGYLMGGTAILSHITVVSGLVSPAGL